MENLLLYLTYAGVAVIALAGFGLLCWVSVKVVAAVTK